MLIIGSRNLVCYVFDVLVEKCQAQHCIKVGACHSCFGCEHYVLYWEI